MSDVVLKVNKKQPIRNYKFATNIAGVSLFSQSVMHQNSAAKLSAEEYVNNNEALHADPSIPQMLVF